MVTSWEMKLGSDMDTSTNVASNKAKVTTIRVLLVAFVESSGMFVQHLLEKSH